MKRKKAAMLDHLPCITALTSSRNLGLPDQEDFDASDPKKTNWFLQPPYCYRLVVILVKISSHDFPRLTAISSRAKMIAAVVQLK